MCGFKQNSVILPCAILLQKYFKDSSHDDNPPLFLTHYNSSLNLPNYKGLILYTFNATMSNMFQSSPDTWYTLLILKDLWNKIPCSKGDRVRPTQKCPQSYGKKHRCVFPCCQHICMHDRSIWFTFTDRQATREYLFEYLNTVSAQYIVHVFT